MNPRRQVVDTGDGRRNAFMDNAELGLRHAAEGNESTHSINRWPDTQGEASRGSEGVNASVAGAPVKD